MFELIPLAPTGSTGNVPGAGVRLGGGTYETVGFQFVVEVAGATPTITYKFQGSMDNVNWYDVGYVTDASDTVSQATRVRTTVGADVEFLSNPLARRYAWFRVVPTANTNITYRAELYRIAA